MFKKMMSLCMAVILLFSAFENMAYAEKKTTDIYNEEYVNPPTEGGGDDGTIVFNDIVDESKDKAELMSYSVYNCKRAVTVHGARDRYFYRSPEATQPTDSGWDKFISETPIYVKGYIESTTVGRRYFTDLECGGGVTAGQIVTFYIPESYITVDNIYHTYGTASAVHPHYKYCDCGASTTTTSSSCYTCNPAYVYYYTNGGNGGPDTQTVTSSTTRVSEIIPKKFKYRFKGWSPSSTATTSSYTPGGAISVSAGISQSLYAVWEPSQRMAEYIDYTWVYIDGAMEYYEFIPAKSGYYTFESVNEGSSTDTKCYLYDADGNQLAYDDDGGEGTNFRIDYYLTAGVTYSYGIQWYDSSKTGYIYARCWMNGIDRYVGSAPIDICETTGYYEFIPTESGTYVFKSTNDGEQTDTRCYLYDVYGYELAYNDDGGEKNNFQLSYELTAGTTYYYGVQWYDSSKTGTIYVELLRQYNITYDANGGSGAPNSQTKLNGNDIILSSVEPVRDLWQFKGWATSSSASTAQYQPGAVYSANGNQTLYAVWGYPTGSCGTNATWTYKNNTLYISGTGAMYDYTESTNAPWKQYADHIQEIVVENGITSIGNYAFSGCNKATSINVASTVNDIGIYAFANCSALTSINIPSGVTVIGEYTFYNCSALTAVSLPATLGTIGERAFQGCSSLKSLTLPNKVTSIGAYAFSGCSKLESVNIPSGVTTIEAYTFNGNSMLKGIVIPDTVRTIKTYAFAGCSSITEITIPLGVTEIQRAAFANCSALKKITIPDSVSTIGTSIFAYIDDNVTVRCYHGSAAHAYAVENGISYELISRGTLASPTFTEKGVRGGKQIGMTASKGTIYYTINGSDPTVNSSVYSGSFKVTKNTTIKAIAVEEGWDNSPVASLAVTVQKVDKPTASCESGTVVSGTKVELYCATDGAEIWYTTDGNIPTESDVYRGAIEITQDTTIYALAVKNGMIDSALATFHFEVSKAESAPLVTTNAATDITETSAKLSADIEEDNGAISRVDFIYYEKNNSRAKYTIEADKSNCAVITGLTPDTEYWYQARALNELGLSTGMIESFRTNAQGEIMPASIEITPGYLTAKVGQKKTLLATVLPEAANNRGIYWSSDDTEVATVDENGVVTAVGLGNTTIRATSVANRLVAECKFEVVSTNMKGEFDFSEHNMITNSSNMDQEGHGFDHHFNMGGNAQMASAYLARWDGAVLEDVDPYPSSPSLVKAEEFDADYHVQNIIYLPWRKDSLDNDEIKNAVMKYGPVYSTFRVNDNYYGENKINYYLPENVNKALQGHAIVIVGWDDNYPSTNFVSTPPGDGAFICKNSYGTNVGEDGYFYISYYDKYLGKAVSGDFNTVFYDIEDNDNYNKIYQYDYLGPVAAEDEWEKQSLFSANVFPENGSALQENEILKAVSFYNQLAGMSYEVYIVTNYQDEKSLNNLGTSVAEGVAEYAGYMTVKLEKEIELDAGTRFAVVVKSTVENGKYAQIYVEVPATIEVNGKDVPHSYNARANEDESYFGYENKGKKIWYDLTDFYPNANCCIKAFTDTESSEIMLQAIDNEGREYTDDTVLTIEEWQEKGLIFNESFIEYFENNAVELFEDNEFATGAMPPSFTPDLDTNHNYAEGAAFPARYDLREEGCMTPVKDQGAIGSCWSFAVYASLEGCLKKASLSSMSTTAGGLSQSANTASLIELNTTGTKIALGNRIQLKASIWPFDSKAELIWKSSNNDVVSVSSHGLVTALGKGNATVTVSTTDGKTSAQCAITVTDPAKVNSITIHNTETEILAGKKLLMDYSVYPENAGDQNIIWEVDDPSVAYVDEYGLLTAASGGVVTVTAYSADKSVSDSYTLNIDDGFECEIDVEENDLAMYDTGIFGSIGVNVKNKGSERLDGTVVMGIYDSHGKTVKILAESKELVPGNNFVEFKKVSVSNLKDSKYTVKIFVWDEADQLKPLAPAKEEKIE